jgi:hypothetical protein
VQNPSVFSNGFLPRDGEGDRALFSIFFLENPILTQEVAQGSDPLWLPLGDGAPYILRDGKVPWQGDKSLCDEEGFIKGIPLPLPAEVGFPVVRLGEDEIVDAGVGDALKLVAIYRILCGEKPAIAGAGRTQDIVDELLIEADFISHLDIAEQGDMGMVGIAIDRIQDT